MLNLLFLPGLIADMVDYDGENRYYGETIRELLFKKPYRKDQDKKLQINLKRKPNIDSVKKQPFWPSL